MAITKIPAAGFTGNNFRNIIINGDMSIAQRGTSITGIGNGDSGYHTVDRWRFQETGAPTAVFTQTQSTDVPTGQGFSNSLKMDCTTADTSLDADIFMRLDHRFEGQMLQYLKKGTSSAESITASFWVKSNKTGTYICEFEDIDNARTINKSYTINSADTWEKKTITFAGDTTGALDNDNERSLNFSFYLGVGVNYSSGTLATSWENRTNANRAVGQVNLADSTVNYINITGVQLEAGTTASDFEFLPYDVNENRCLRYYQILTQYGDATNPNTSFGLGTYYSTTAMYAPFPTKVRLRASPSIDQTSGTDYYRIYRNGGSDGFNNFVLSSYSNTRHVELTVTSGVSGTAGQAGFLRTLNSNAYIAFDAEL